MSFLPAETALGRLQLLETYDYYDGPRLFAARNAVGTTFFVLWADATETDDEWLYAPVSVERLSDLRDGLLTIRDGFLKAEDGVVFRVVQSKSTGQAKAEAIPPTSISTECLPPEGDSIAVADVSADLSSGAEPSPLVRAEGRPAWLKRHALQRISISRRKGQFPPALSAVTGVLDAWVRVFEDTLKARGCRAELLPVRATPGSFVLDLAIEDPAAASAAFRRIVDLFQRQLPSGALEELIAEGKIPPSSYRDLLEAVAAEDLDVRVQMVSGRTQGELKFEPATSQALRVPAARSARTRLESMQIPQADDVARVFRVLELTSHGREVTADQLKVVPRQVAYYKHAGRLLGYLDDANEPTGAGLQVIRLDPEERLISAAMHYEGADCGAAWVAWSKANSLAEVDPHSAEEFLAEVSDLSESTAFRRAKTLRSWHGAVMPYHYRRWFKSRPGSST